MRYLFSLKVAYWSFDRLWWLQSGLGDRREHIIVQYWASFMVLRCLVLGSVLSGSGFGSVCWDGMLLTILMGFRGSIAWFWLLVKVVQGMDFSTFCRRVMLRLVLAWDSMIFGWWRPGLPSLSNMAGPLEHLKTAILDAWREKVSGELCERKGFGVVPSSILVVLCTYLTRPIFGNEKKRCCGVSWLEASGIDFIPEKFEGKLCHAVSVRDIPKFTS